MEFEFDKYCKVVVTGESPRTVLPSSSSRHKSEFKLEKKKLREKASRCMNNEQLDQLRLRRNYYDPSVVSCKSLPSSNCNVDLEGKQVLKRGGISSHVDQSRFQGLDNSNNNNIGCRKKIEYSLAGDSSFSFSILDSICGSDQEEDGGGGGGGGGEEPPFEEKRSSVTTSPYWSTTACSSNSSRESSSRSRDCLQDHPMRRASSKSNALLVLEQQQQRDAFAFSKSQSSKHASPSSSPTQAEEEEGYYFHKTGLKSRFSPFRKMFGPITKSKSLRSPLSSPSVEEDMMMRLAQRPASILRNDKKMLRKSLLNDFSSTVMDYSSFASMKISEQQQQEEESQSVNVACRCSPAHLHGILKLNHKHGAPYFEFSVKHPEEFLAAKTWKAEDTFSWVYTFHSLQSRKKSSHSSTTGWGIKCSNNKDSPPIPMVGQMQVFSYLGLGLKDEGDLMVSEFVLYDILYAKKGGGGGGVAAEEKSALSPSKVCSVSSARGITELDDLFDSVKLKQNTNNGHDRGRSGFSTPYPFAPVDLHPSTEIGAIVVQVPIENRETLKYKKGDKLDTISSPTKELAKIDGTSAVKVNAITTMGNHGLPSNESSGPSPLLDRWRSGGGCDCGGWDMACPLLVFDTITPKVQYGTKGHSLLGSQEPFQLSVKGAKEKIPSLSITATEKGQYSIDFHAHLSSLQAFAICVAILHASDAWSSSTDQEKKETTLLEASDLQVRNDDEVKILVKAFADEEETRKVRKSRKATVENIPSFIVNPPFSPVARV